jgi:prepilin-type N-terminal cleavage/methylation domain-containing protein
VKRDGARPLAAPRFFVPRRCAGWSLLELSVVLAIAAVLIFFTVRSYQPKEAIALQQAERLRNDLRHAQMLAITWNQPLRVTTTANNYSISCVTAGASPCDANPVVNPVNGQPYLVALESGLTLAGPGFNLDLDALGRPKNAATFISANATFTITGGTTTRTVVVAPVTAFASAQ